MYCFIFLFSQNLFAGKRETKNVNVGDQITLYSTYHGYTQSVLWNWDTGVLELVGRLYDTSTSATFKVKKASPLSGVVVQATTYYHKQNTTATGINKDLDTWRIYAKDNSTVSLSESSLVLDLGDNLYITATPSNATYSGNYKWTSSNSNVAYITGTGKRVILNTYSPGNTRIRVTLDNNNYAECQVVVNQVDPERATITSPININTNQSKSLIVSVYPSNARVTSEKWYISQGKENISLTSAGVLTGLKPGVASIYCIINNTIQSNFAQVIVSEPAFYVKQTYPQNKATNISSLATPSVTYSLNVYKSQNYNSIKLLNENTNEKVKGEVSITNANLKFTPKEALLPNTNYRFDIPSKAVSSQWGAYIDSTISISFQTANWDTLSLTFSDSERFVHVGHKVHLQASVSDASIYYTLNGSDPSTTSMLYTDSIVIMNDTKIRAIAVHDGFWTSAITEKEYLISHKTVIEKFPEKEQLYNYDYLVPYIKYCTKIEAGPKIDSVRLIQSNEFELSGQVIIADSTIFFIPTEPIKKGNIYTMDIPADAIRTLKGESNDSISWSFATGDFVTAIALGHEIGAAYKTDGKLLTWGNLYQSGDYTNGSYTMLTNISPSVFLQGDIDTVSLGYMHNALIKSDKTLWMWGRQYCGEFGVNSHQGTSLPIKVMDSVLYVSAGGQHTAFIKEDNTLWMCGRNDFGQLGDSSLITRMTPVKVLDNVIQVAAGWCTTYAITSDYQLWGWGRNDKYQLGNDTTTDSWQPTKLLDDVLFVTTSPTQCKWTAVIMKDHSLWIFGEGYHVPTKILDNICSVAVGVDYLQAIKKNGTLWAFGANELGQLGINNTISVKAPELVMDSVNHVAVGAYTSVGLMTDGSVRSWGDNRDNLLGYVVDPSVSYGTTPQQIIEGLPSSALNNLVLRKKNYHLAIDGSNVINVMPSPLNADFFSVKWTSLNTDIVIVSSLGVLTPVAIGETEVIVEIMDGTNSYSQTCRIVVSEDGDFEFDDSESAKDKVYKIIRNQQLLIIRGEDIYSILGAKIRNSDWN